MTTIIFLNKSIKIPIVFVNRQKNIFCGVPQNFILFKYFKMKKVEKLL